MPAEKGNEYTLIHGHNRLGKRTKAYRTWSHIRARCDCPTDRSYKNYGGRGIKVCDRWQHFDNFLADMGNPPAEMSIERVNNDGDYELSNCRWIDRSLQQKNTRRTIHIGGLCLKDYCDKHGLPYEAIQMRIRRGMTPEQAVSVRPIRNGKGRVQWVTI